MCGGTHHRMDDSSNKMGDMDTKPKSKEVHLIVREATRTLLEETREVLRVSDLKAAPPDILNVLKRDWTAEVLVTAGCMALIDLIRNDAVARLGLGPEAEEIIRGVRSREGLLDADGRLRALEFVLRDYARITSERPGEPALKPASKSKVKR